MMRLKNPVIYIVTIAITLWFASQVLYPASRTLTHGYGAYYSAARLLKTGQFSAQVYDPAYFRPVVRADSHQQADDIYNANPPTTSLILWPLSFFSIESARLLWTLANAGMLLGGLALLTFTLAPQPSLRILAILVSLGMLFPPAVENIKLGQAYLLIFLLLSITVVAWSKFASPRVMHHKNVSPLKFLTEPLGGAALALALTLKTAGWALLPLLVWQKHWRYLAGTGTIAGVILLLSLPLFPLSTWLRYWQLLHETNNSASTCAAAYQTTRSLLCHLFVFDETWNNSPIWHLPWLATTLLIGLALFTLACNLKLSRHNQTLAFSAAIAWGVIFAPLGEQYHHTVMLIPLSWLVVNWSTLNKFSQVTLFAAICLYLLPLPPNQPQWQNGWWALVAYPRVYGAWLVWLSLYCTPKDASQEALRETTEVVTTNSSFY